MRWFVLALFAACSHPDEIVADPEPEPSHSDDPHEPGEEPDGHDGEPEQPEGPLCGYDILSRWPGADIADDSPPTFTHRVTDLSMIHEILPPPGVSGDVLKVHAYFKTQPGDSVPVYAPTRLTLSGAEHYEQEGGQYKISFEAGCTHLVYVDHVDEPVEAIALLLPSEPTADGGIFLEPEDRIVFEAGDLIGWTGEGSSRGSWDFGVLDLTYTAEFANPERYEGSHFTQGVCPFGLYEDVDRTAFGELFATGRGVRVPHAPCGDGSEDVPGTLAGTWFEEQTGLDGRRWILMDDLDGTVNSGGIWGEGMIEGPSPSVVDRGCYRSGDDLQWAWLWLDAEDDARLHRHDGEGPCPEEAPAAPQLTFTR